MRTSELRRLDHRRRADVDLLPVSCCAPRSSAAGGDHHVGRVTLPNGMPVPGARVTATQGNTTLVTTTDAQGAYRFAALADGAWTIQVDDGRFSTPAARGGGRRRRRAAGGVAAVGPAVCRDHARRSDSTAGAAARSSRGARRRGRRPRVGTSACGIDALSARPVVSARRVRHPRRRRRPGSPPRRRELAAGRGRPPPLRNRRRRRRGHRRCVPRERHGQHGRRAAVGRQRARPTGIRLFRGQVSVDGTNSAWDAQPVLLDRLAAEKPDTSRLSRLRDFPGPVPDSGADARNRNLLLQYNRNVNNGANTLSELMPTLLQRNGDFSQTVDGFGVPCSSSIRPPACRSRATSSPPSASARRPPPCSRYYPLPQPVATGTFNYQIPAFNSTMNNSVNASIANLVNNTTNLLGVNGGYSRTSNDSTSLFGFDDASRRFGHERRTQLDAPLHPVEPAAAPAPHLHPADEHVRAVLRQPHQRLRRGRHHRQQPGAGELGPAQPLVREPDCRTLDGQYSLNRTQSHAFNVETPRTSAGTTLVIGGNVELPDDRLSRRSRTRAARSRSTARSPDTTSPTSCSAFRTRAPSRTGNADKGFRAWNYDAYVNDDFRVNPSLTIIFGVRWEFEAPVTERLGAPRQSRRRRRLQRRRAGDRRRWHWPDHGPSLPGIAHRVGSLGHPAAHRHRLAAHPHVVGHPPRRLRDLPEHVGLPVAGAADGAAAAALVRVQRRQHALRRR